MFLIEQKSPTEAQNSLCAAPADAPERGSHGDACPGFGIWDAPKGQRSFLATDLLPWHLGSEKGWRDRVAFGEVERG